MTGAGLITEPPREMFSKQGHFVTMFGKQAGQDVDSWADLCTSANAPLNIRIRKNGGSRPNKGMDVATKSLVSSPSLANLNISSGLGLEAGWPDVPFTVTIPTSDPHEDCYLSFPVVGDRLGTASENRYFILETLEQIAKLQAQPTGSVAQGFYASGYDMRFGMEPVPQHPLSLDLACAALRIMYNIVVDSEAHSNISTTMSAVSTSPAVPKAIVFDLMGTCVDWCSSILPALKSAPTIPALPSDSLPQLAADWRAGFFKETQTRKEASQAVEDIDVTHRRVLNWLLLARGVTPAQWDDGVRNKLVGAWHEQTGWPDVAPALERLKQRYFIVVLANGSTRLQLDIMKSSNLPFHTLFSSQMLGKAKPDAECYTKALELMQVAPSEAIMVAAHAYDLRAAKTVGMKTIYVQRTTEDLIENMDQVRDDVDFFIDGVTARNVSKLQRWVKTEKAQTCQEQLELTGFRTATTPYGIFHLPDRVAYEQEFAYHLH
ncbi:MAG: hypothetical protein ASARMPRED_007728 [Alectoria sarmentosa]|nr:MAG: hypothetical protein ASARMPRED_007728 [Alectoria sarmentosa]